MFSLRTSASKCVTEPALEVGRSVASPSEDVRLDRRLQCALVGGDKAERVAEPGGTLDVGGAAVERNRDEQVEVRPAVV